MSKNVTTAGMMDVFMSINNSIDNAESRIGNLIDQLNKIKGLSQSFGECDGKKVAGFYADERISTGNLATPGFITRRWFYRWLLHGYSEVSSNCDQVISELESKREALSSLKKEASNIPVSADAINEYINNILNTLGGNIDFGKAFTTAGISGALINQIAYDENQAANGQFISKDKILTDYWTDKPLIFEKQENGTYGIYQEDDNGNLVIMGFTTSSAALSYVTSLGKTSGVLNFEADSSKSSNSATGSAAVEGSGGIHGSSSSFTTESPSGKPVTHSSGSTVENGGIRGSSSSFTTETPSGEPITHEHTGSAAVEGSGGIHGSSSSFTTKAPSGEPITHSSGSTVENGGIRGSSSSFTTETPSGEPITRGNSTGEGSTAVNGGIHGSSSFFTAEDPSGEPITHSSGSTVENGGIRGSSSSFTTETPRGEPITHSSGSTAVNGGIHGSSSFFTAEDPNSSEEL